MSKKKLKKNLHIGMYQSFTVKAGSTIISDDGKEYVVGSDVKFDSRNPVSVPLMDNELKQEPIFQFKAGDRVEIQGLKDTYKVFKVLGNNVLVIERMCDRFKRTINGNELVKCDPDKVEQEKYLAMKRKQDQELEYLRKVLE